ncbi:MAG: aldo/keto reductase [Bryobacteraceae bacterium]
MLDRREFLTASLAAAIARKAPGAERRAIGEWRNKHEQMAYRRFGRTGFMISEMVMGGNTIAPDNWEHVLPAMDMGLNYLDTAPAYGKGKSELGYAHVLKARRRDTFFLNTKISLWDDNRSQVYAKIFSSLPESEQKKLRTKALDAIEKRRVLDPDYLGGYFKSQAGEVHAAALADAVSEKYGDQIDRGKNYRKLIIDSFHESLRRLGTDHTDILMCPHGASTPTEILRHPEIFEAFEELKQQGKVRYLGVSAHSDPAGILEAAMQAKVYSVAMLAYSIVNHRFMAKQLEKARKADFGVIAMKVARPVYNGRGDGTKDDPARVKLIQDAVPGPIKVPHKAYLWALRNPNLSGVISELVNLELVKDNLPLAAAQKSGHA